MRKIVILSARKFYFSNFPSEICNFKVKNRFLFKVMFEASYEYPTVFAIGADTNDTNLNISAQFQAVKGQRQN